MDAIPPRRIGRTGLMLPMLGLGAMDTPESPEGAATIAAALDEGVRFIDTARDYAGSEMLLGRVFRERGGAGDAFVASKTFSRTASGAQYDIDRSLRVLGLPQIPLYQLHDISTREAWDAAMAEGGALDGLKTAQYRGLIAHIGVSTHDLDLARECITSGEFDTIMLEYSAFDPAASPVIDLAAEHDVAVIVMRPVGGSGRTSVMRQRIAGGTAGILTPANLLRYAWSHPGVSIAIPGARHPDRITQNAHTARSYAPMPAAERAELERAARGLW